jgi:hypothetical protein
MKRRLGGRGGGGRVGTDLNVIHVREDESLCDIKATGDDIFRILVGQSTHRARDKEERVMEVRAEVEVERAGREGGLRIFEHAVLVSLTVELLDQQQDHRRNPCAESIDHHQPPIATPLHWVVLFDPPVAFFKFQICFEEELLIVCELDHQRTVKGILEPLR